MKSQNKIKVLYFIDREDGRDIEIFLPVYFYLKERIGAEIKMSIMYDAHQIKYFKPDIVILPNTIGSEYYFLIGKLCNERDIPVFAFDSEGNFAVDGSFQHWGYNLEKNYYQEYVCCWSERTRDYLKKTEPNFAQKIITTGNIGSDRYKIYDFMSKDEYLNSKGKTNFKYVVGYAAWAFAKPNYPTGRIDLIAYFKGDESRLTTIEPQRQEVEAVLEYAIQNNPDTLFILKVHPLEKKLHENKKGVNECDNLEKYDNVIIEYNFNISDLINICDLWTSFESTTSLEAWLIEKQTLIILTNPDFSPNLSKSKYDIAQPQIPDGKKFHAYIQEYKETGRIADFYADGMAEIRNSIVAPIFGFADGMNHLRSIKYFHLVLEDLPNRNQVYKTNFRFWLLHYLILLGRPLMKIPGVENFWKFKKFKWVFRSLKFKNFDNYYKERKPQFEAFYEANNLYQRIEKEDLLNEITKMND